MDPKIIIIGGGLSGLMSAIKICEKGQSVAIFSVVPVKRSHSVCAQGGINAALNTKGEGDSVEQHIFDTTYGGDFLGNQDAIKELCEAAPGIAGMYDRMGVMFNRTPEGRIDLRLFGGVRHRRTLFSGGTTGQQLMYALDEQVRKFESLGLVKKFENWEFLSLVKDGDGLCRGITAMDLNTMEVRAFSADAVIMCTGGFGQLYGCATNSTHCNGSAASACYQQGAFLANPEFVQFHPTAIQGEDKRRLISEAVRGEGGRVWTYRDGKPWYFLEEWYPAYGNTVPRDVASRAIWKVVKEMGLGVEGQEAVYLDVTHIDPEILRVRLEGVLEIYQKFVGDDPTKVPMKVFPAVHYSMGGLYVDLDHMTNVPGLFAAGECDYQYHGANRLGANSLLSATFSGLKAGPSAMKYVKGLKKSCDALPASLFDDELQRQKEINSGLMSRDGGENPHLLKNELANLMMQDVMVLRYNKQLEEGAKKIVELTERFKKVSPLDSGSWANDELPFMRQLYNQLIFARAIILAALKRDESRGAHYKPEFPNRDDANWMKTTKVRFAGEKEPALEYEPVEPKYIKPIVRRYDVAPAGK
jgi:succinate dehydrogenase / fumarate reductase flavoprotein subunit